MDLLGRFMYGGKGGGSNTRQGNKSGKRDERGGKTGRPIVVRTSRDLSWDGAQEARRFITAHEESSSTDGSKSYCCTDTINKFDRRSFSSDDTNNLSLHTRESGGLSNFYEI